MSWREQAKKRAAIEAVRHVKDGFVLGLGSGSTVGYVIQEVGRRVKREGLRVLGVPTSYQAFVLAVRSGVSITTLDEHPQIDLAIDGADQIDTELNLIKGMGGALTREKVVASAAEQFIVVADETKLTDKLGVGHSVPVEVLPFASSTVMLRLEGMGGEVVLRESGGKVGPVVTDNGNFVLDVGFGVIDDPRGLDVKIKCVPGVVETGLFVGMVDVVYVGGRIDVRRLERRLKG